MVKKRDFETVEVGAVGHLLISATEVEEVGCEAERAEGAERGKGDERKTEEKVYIHM